MLKGLLLAAGSGTRLRPLTTAVNKQLLPIYDKPMVYYPLSALMLAGIRDILLISTPRDLGSFKILLDDGRQWGLTLSYAVQETPRGIADALLIGRDFLAGERSALVLGDNLFFGSGFEETLEAAVRRQSGATVFACPVDDPRRFGVVAWDGAGKVVSLEEKPAEPRSRYAVPGLYFYDHQAPDLAAELTPSARGELEITDLNRAYMTRGQLHVERLGADVTWLDSGTPDALLQAAGVVEATQAGQGRMVGCVEEVAFRKGYIDRDRLRHLAEPLANTAYGAHLLALADGLE